MWCPSKNKQKAIRFAEKWVAGENALTCHQSNSNNVVMSSHFSSNCDSTFFLQYPWWKCPYTTEIVQTVWEAGGIIWTLLEKSHEKTTINEFKQLQKNKYSPHFDSIVVHKQLHIKTVALGDMSLHYHRYTHTVVYFQSIPHNPSCSHQFSLDD